MKFECLLWVSLLAGFLTAPSQLYGATKPDVTRHEAKYLGGAVNIHVEWQSPNPVALVTINVGNMQKEIKVDPYENERNRDGYAGEVTVTLRLESLPSQPLTYVVQLEDELRIKGALVTGSVKIPAPQQQPGIVSQPQQPSMQIQIQQGVSQPGPQSSPKPQAQQKGPQPYSSSPIKPGGQTPGSQPAPQTHPAPTGGQQAASLSIVIMPQNIADGGGMWRVANGPWKRSGETVSDVPIGVQMVEFQDVPGWTKPENQRVKFEPGDKVALSGMYSSK